MLRTLAAALGIIMILGGATLWLLTAPRSLDAAVLAEAPDGDAARGERVFWTAGCTSCHARPRAEGEAVLELAGGLELKTAFGTFVAPNISQHERDGIGGWSFADFANSMLRGVSPGGSHLYPAFPYASYARMDLSDVADLYAFMRTLPAVEGRPGGHSLDFPYNIRRGIGVWKLLNLHPEPVVALADDAPEAVRRGRYLVEGPGHCGECHTPRNRLGGSILAQWLAGAVAAEGDGIVPNITGGEGGIADWSHNDIAYYLESGFTPDFDSVGGAMVAVQKNTARLPAEDLAAIAAYLKAAPPHPNGYPARRPATQ
ncbi:cytochrome c [Mesorhizobium xinjiangense]|uniref:cytochrome c n=1 Tax=Mesorhizobium xinjiangense TaxID=2678685 RepID=UPI0012EE9162|nr:cytochrome c [Mesorhizobium xinjiangense]